ncbi:hypothetical protein ACEWY4_006798 [Coilia grayii]|uniref:DDE Tnp4 domain-containing protein n=1 Tax=Coilia grayii TaxID=363190 RepID=A0ABD1KF21_9TELE
MFRPKRTPGVQLDPHMDYRQCDLFQLFFSKEVVRVLCSNTNLYTAKKIAEGRKRKWSDVGTDEVCHFMRLIVYHGLVKTSAGRDVWRSHVMLGYRYEAIMAFFHMSDPADDAANDLLWGQPGFDVYFLIGDGGHLCLSYPITLMTPYPQPLRNQLQAAYNSRLTKARVVVERAFRILKIRWRAIFLKALEVDIRYVPEVILCSTILHNMNQGDVLDDEDGVAGAAGEEDPGREAAPPGSVLGAQERDRLTWLCYTPQDQDYI